MYACENVCVYICRIHMYMNAMTHKCIYMIIHKMYTYACAITLNARLH